MIPKNLLLTSDSLSMYGDGPSNCLNEQRGGYTRWLGRGYGDKQVEVYPGIRQSTDLYRNYQYDVWQTLESEFRGHKSSSWSGVTSALSDWGQPSDLCFGPLRSNLNFRKELGLDNNLDDRAFKVLDDLLNFIFENREAKSVHLNNVSHSGPPYFIIGAPYKKHVAKRVLNNISKFLIAFNDNHISQLVEFDCLPAFSTGIRVQGDGIKINDNGLPFVKLRSYPTVDMITDNTGEINKIAHPTYTVRDEFGNIDDRFQSGRARLMYAYSYPANFILQYVNNMLIAGLKRGDIISYSGPDDLCDELKRRGQSYIYCLDCSNFGETFHPEITDRFLDFCERYFDLNLADFIRNTFDSPVMISSLKKNKQLPPFVNRALFSEEREDWKGRASFKSGHGLVALLGKIQGTFMGLNLLNEILGIEPLDVIRGLTNRVTFKNSGDDSLFAFRDKQDRDLFAKAIADKNKSSTLLFKINEEDPPKYLGYLYLDGKVYLSSNVCVERLISTERSYKLKSYHGYGHMLRKIEFRNRCCEAVSIYKIISNKMREHFRFDLEQYLIKADRPEVCASYADRMFITDPAYFHYKLAPEDISPELLQSFYHVMEVEELENLVKLTF